jgi:putative PIN family toxin of toxin-antitoxin system
MGRIAGATLSREAKEGELVTSQQLLGELGKALRREKFRRYVTEAETDAYVEFLRHESIILDDPQPPPEPLSDDPDDEYLITLARSARAQALVSGDDHLLRLRGVIPVVIPHDFLNSLQNRK